ncbi:hypothetical protein E0W29_08410 [Neisseria meningitidis]|nr:hypothetical protein [Neisseria meningitidis]
MRSAGRAVHAGFYSGLTKIRTRRRAADSTNRDLCKIPFPPDIRNPNTGFRLFSYQISPFPPDTP